MSDFFKKLSRKYKSPEQIQKLINTFEYNFKETQKSGLTAYKTKSAHCLEAAVMTAALLEQHGYPPLVLSLESKDNLDHVVFIFKRKNKWGAISQSRDRGLKGRAPAYRSIRDLVWSYFDPYVDKTGRITAYQIANLNDYNDVDWRESKKNIWKLEKYLIDLKHKKLKSSNLRYKKFYQLYLKNGPLPLRENWW